MSDFMVEMMQHDFKVEVIAQKENAHLMLGIRGSHYHFVESIQDGSFNTMDQHHIPRYQMAYWFDSLSSNKEATSVRPLSANISPSFRLTLFADDQVEFSSVVDYILKEKDSEKFFNAVKKDVSRLRRAKTLIQSNDNGFYIDGITTQKGLPIETGILDEDDLLMIAYDYLLYKSLRKQPEFGLYVMYSYLIDNQFEIPENNFMVMACQLHGIGYDELSPEEGNFFMNVQKKYFPKQIWGKQAKVTQEETARVIKEVYTNLDPVKKVQFKSLSEAHGTYVFVLIAYIFQNIKMSSYIELCTRGHQPDSIWEQKIRYDSNVIQMFIDKFFSKK
ncbi:MAG: hypothetical protein WCR01_05760 [Bacteroidota bacterium]